MQLILIDKYYIHPDIQARRLPILFFADKMDAMSCVNVKVSQTLGKNFIEKESAELANCTGPSPPGIPCVTYCADSMGANVFMSGNIFATAK